MDKKASSQKTLAFVASLLVLSLIAPNASATKIAIEATADSYVESVSPNDNHGGSEYLHCYYYTEDMFGQTYSQEDHTYLKFSMASIPMNAKVNSIILRLHTWSIAPSATNRVGVFVCSSSSWIEMTIKWNYCPKTTGSAIATAYVSTSDKDYDFDVTTAVKDKTTVTLVLKTLEPTSLGSFATFYSKEAYNADYAPKLMVDYTIGSETGASQTLALIPILGAIAGVATIVAIILVVYIVAKRRKSTIPTPPKPPQTMTTLLYNF